ncbi:alkaline phosphatase D family protein [Corynebacterium hansenii]|uniref:Alkaline phosphatase D family protein n=1 Tax=Corynebacterium hansenii TaxID=394964 RepID=A0ABV7ZRD0_9CORY|nr:alkaline phosphatase D family protein [Corynebacterium hansenii]WJZ01266.1 Phospholipase D precursor [Corynebacterium hansenii]
MTFASGSSPSSPTPSRRTVLKAGAATAALVGTSSLAGRFTAAAQEAAQQAVDAGGHAVFQHGVASGDPLPDSVLLWTRATSNPDDIPGSGAGTVVKLLCEVATDDSFSEIVLSGETTASPDNDNTVKLDATGLRPDTRYWYRFTVADGEYAGQVSPIGRTRTAPAASATPDKLGIALTSCANWEAGYFSAYRDMADNPDVDVIMCVGDYLYEYASGEYAAKDGAIRNHEPAHEIISLSDYRRRYGHYRTDADLQAAHAAKPWLVTWDDHEIADDAHATGADNHSPESEGDYAARRDAAYQAYLEWLPVRATPLSQGGHLYRAFAYGTLADITMLDLRTYRDKAPEFVNARDTDDENRTMLGSEQMKFLHNRWSTSSASWNLVGNSVMFTPVLIPPLDPQTSGAITELMGLPQEGIPYNSDQWDGYAHERRRLIQIMSEQGLDNVVFLTGDIHSSWACDVPVAPGRYPADGVAAAEIVCTSVSSPNIDDIVKLPPRNPISLAAEQALSTANRHVKWVEFDNHGYVSVHVRADEIVAEYRFVDDKTVPNRPLHTAARYRVRRGEGVSPA